MDSVASDYIQTVFTEQLDSISEGSWEQNDNNLVGWGKMPLFYHLSLQCRNGFLEGL